ncbi:hypothetical protein FKG94_04715 [Exilibacterium tricleocarpae]|uniref:Uncharacterized protein n=1 Tax=Exilibacterium tricleocarpae TaxID=2591008 RepID=A0A545U5S5_9GAMM|nr:hypothetical protein [Exilibacterium tricleocarpae]TQV84820.1 hypothetical protein FKG94_04715 [Exilibacterium tricleocarpae]
MKFDETFLMGLFLFIRMLQLSFDRALGGKWADMVDYLGGQPNCRDIIFRLSEISGYDVPPKAMPSKPVANSFSVAKPLFGKFVLKEDELSFICWWLLQAAGLIERTEYEPSADEIVEIRVNLAYAEDLIRTRLGVKDHSVEYVEHFNQSKMNKCRSIEEIVGEPWPSL